MRNLFTKAFLATSVLIHSIPAHARSVIASVYHPWYHNRPDYCGSIYNHNGVSAAHRTLPCGTKVKVTYKGRSITVPIRDRCACGDRIDLSGGAARALGIPVNTIRLVTVNY